MKRRLLRILLIAVLVVAFTGYFAFSTFLFSPLEGRYGFDVSTLVPRDVDYFVAKADLAGDFGPNLVPEFAEDLAKTELGKAFFASPEWQELRDANGLGELQERIATELGKLPIDVDPLAVFGGRDLAIAGRVAGSGPKDARWAVYGRTNWMGKLGTSLLDYPGMIGLSKAGLEVSTDGGIKTLSGGQLTEPIHVVRVRDVLVATNELEYATAAVEFRANKGQDSLGQSARYFDEIAARDRDDQDELEVLVRAKDVATWMGWPMDYPKTTSLNEVEAFLGRLFQVGLARELAGVVRFDGGLAGDLSGSLLTENLSSLQKRLYRKNDLDSRDLIEDVARRAPSDVGLFATLEMDIGDLIEAWIDAMEDAKAENLRTEVLKPVLGHATIESFAAELDATFEDRLMFTLAANRYREIEQEIPNNGDPVLVWTLALWVEDAQKVRDLIDKLSRNPGRLGLRGAMRDNGSYDPGIYENEVSGGLRVYEYWSMAVPGTGHMATMQGGDVFLISNHYLELSRIAETYTGSSGTESLAERPEFLGLASSALPSSTLSVWLDPAKVAEDLRALLKNESEKNVFRRVDLEAEAQRIKKALLAERYPNVTWGQQDAEIDTELNMLVGPEVQKFRDQFRQQNLPQVFAEVDRNLSYLEGLDVGFAQLRLEPKSFQLALRVLTALSD